MHRKEHGSYINLYNWTNNSYDYVMTQGYILYHSPFMRETYESPFNSPHNGPLMWNVSPCRGVIVMDSYIDGLMQDRRNSIVNALGMRLSCSNPTIKYMYHNQHPPCIAGILTYFTVDIYVYRHSIFIWNVVHCSLHDSATFVLLFKSDPCYCLGMYTIFVQFILHLGNRGEYQNLLAASRGPIVFV